MNACRRPPLRTRDHGASIDSSRSFAATENRDWWSSFNSISGQLETPSVNAFLIHLHSPQLSLLSLKPCCQPSLEISTSVDAETSRCHCVATAYSYSWFIIQRFWGSCEKKSMPIALLQLVLRGQIFGRWSISRTFLKNPYDCIRSA